MKINKTNGSALFLIILYLVGFVGTIQSVNWVQNATPIHLLFCLGLFIFCEDSKWSPKQILTAITLFLFGIGIEWVGVQTTLPFGAYHYGSRLGIKLDGIPMTMGINWLLLSLLSAELARSVLAKKGLAWQALLGSLLMVLTDLPMELICSKLDFWYWDLGAAPWQNYVAWFVLGVGVQYFVLFSRKEVAINRLSWVLYVLQLLFFSGLILFLKD
jgi:putative membrane protein